MKIEKEVSTRVEGNALFELIWDNGSIKDAKVLPSFARGIEKIVLGRYFMDALVILPRV